MKADLFLESAKDAIVIRSASVEDLTHIVKIWSEGQIAQGDCPSEPGETIPSFRRHLEAQNGVFGIWVAEHKEAVIGWQSLHRCRANPIHRWAEASTYISEKWRGWGIGRRLLAFAMEHAKTVNLSYITGFIKAEDERSIRTVESLG